MSKKTKSKTKVTSSVSSKDGSSQNSRIATLKKMMLKKKLANHVSTTTIAKPNQLKGTKSLSVKRIPSSKPQHKVLGESKKQSSSPNYISKFQKKLDGARFRWINEQLYTMQGKDALALFEEDPNLFNVYHYGYREQVKHWPRNPVDVMISFTRDHMVPAENRVVVDFGCGDGKLARSVQNRVYSIDLVKTEFEIPSDVIKEIGKAKKNKKESILKDYFVNPKNFELAHACDMSRTPLDKSCAHLAVFSLSLMGTNFMGFIKEANRVLKNQIGIMKIAEVNSRIDDLESLIRGIEANGFALIDKDESNNVFIDLTFKKCKDVGDISSKQNKKKGKGNPRESLPTSSSKALLKPCLYKKR